MSLSGEDGGPSDFRFLCAGFDTLDVGVDVNWHMAMFELFEEWQHQLNERRLGNKPIWRRPGIGEAIVTHAPGSKRNYRWQIQTPDGIMWVSNHDEPKGYPNVYLSPSAESLWVNGASATLETWRHVIDALGGEVLKMTVSRVDLTADFMLDPPLSLDFVRAHRVSKSSKVRPYEEADRLQTVYIGDGKGKIQLRIYDKLTAILTTKKGAHMLPIWGGPVPAWRVEFQLRRSKLREFGIDSLDDLREQAGGLWSYLTGKWASFRLHDSKHTTRRAVHPWWAAVQNCADLFGPSCELARGEDKPPAVDPSWYVAHIGGCLASLAACWRSQSIARTLDLLNEELDTLYTDQKWQDRVARECIRRGRSTEPEGGDDVSI